MVCNLSHTFLLHWSHKPDLMCKTQSERLWLAKVQPTLLIYSLKLFSHSLVYFAAIMAAGFVIYLELFFFFWCFSSVEVALIPFPWKQRWTRRLTHVPPRSHPIRRIHHQQGGTFFSMITISTIIPHHQCFRCKRVSLQSALSFIDQCDGSIVSAFHRLQYLFVSRFNGGRWCGSRSRVGGLSDSVEDWGDFWGSSFRVCTPYLWLLQMCFHAFFPRHSPKWLMSMFLFWPFDKMTRIVFFIWVFIILLVKSLRFSFILSLICPSCKSINFMGCKPCEHSLLTGTNRKVTDPSGGSYWSVTMDYPYHGVVSFKTSLKPCGATGTNPQVLEPLTITFQPFLKGLEKLGLAC